MKILLAYDGLDHSRNTLPTAVELARKEGAEITILSVVPPDARGSKSGGHVGLRPHAGDDVAKAHAYLREHGIESEMRMENGDPATEIARVAEEGGYDLILVGSRGLTAVGELFLGSVSKTLVRRASRPVLVAGENSTAHFEPPAQA